jgi:lipopolysaccharide transport system ATP-binding protein
VTVLELHDVWKGYRDVSGRPRTLRGMAPGGLLHARRRPRRWALRGVSLSLPAGMALGLVGHNGAGKSTLLRLASGLGRPSRGRVLVHPRTASVLNLGSTFDHELTGRENAYTALLVAGHDRGAALRKVGEVLAFAELEDYADAPVRTYSDGMRLRLAFSSVAAMDPALLILDEVLAVGDIAFRRRCEERVADLRAGGTSLILVSHSLEEIGQTCERAAWLHRGELRAVGETGMVLDAYRGAMHERTLARTPVGALPADAGPPVGERRIGSQEIRVADVRIAGPGGDPVTTPGGPLTVTLRLESERAVTDPIVVVSLRRRADQALVLDLSTRADGVRLGAAVTHAVVELRIDSLAIAGGEYEVDVGVFEADWEYAYDFQASRHVLRVEGPVAGSGVLLPPHRWSVGT